MLSNSVHAPANTLSLMKILYGNYTIVSQLNRMLHPQYSYTRRPSNRFRAKGLPQQGLSITSLSPACSRHLYHQALPGPIFAALAFYLYTFSTWPELYPHFTSACPHHFLHTLPLLLASSLFLSLLLRR